MRSRRVCGCPCVCACISLSAGLKCHVANGSAILETPLRFGSERGRRGIRVCGCEGGVVFDQSVWEESFPGCACVRQWVCTRAGMTQVCVSVQRVLLRVLIRGGEVWRNSSCSVLRGVGGIHALHNTLYEEMIYDSTTISDSTTVVKQVFQLTTAMIKTPLTASPDLVLEEPKLPHHTLYYM